MLKMERRKNAYNIYIRAPQILHNNRVDGSISDQWKKASQTSASNRSQTPRLSSTPLYPDQIWGRYGATWTRPGTSITSKRTVRSQQSVTKSTSDLPLFTCSSLPDICYLRRYPCAGFWPSLSDCILHLWRKRSRAAINASFVRRKFIWQSITFRKGALMNDFYHLNDAAI